MNIKEFIQNFKDKKVINTKINDHAISDYLKENLEIKTYIPFRERRSTVELVVSQNTTVEGGIKKIDSINQYIAFVVAMISLHTNLMWSEDPVADYDMLAESGLLPLIIAEFKESYDECDVLLKMAVAAELEDNNINTQLGKFLNSILQKIDIVGNILGDKLGSINVSDVLGGNFKEEDLTKLKGFLDRYNK